MPSRPFIFQPLVVLILSLSGALLYAAWASSRFSESQMFYQYLYVVPIVVPFVAFLFDRAESIALATVAGLTIDALVVGTSMARGLGHVPLISGHALFLTYALASARSRVAQATAALILLQVIYLKFFIWHDPVTPLSGITLGLLAAFLKRRYGKSAATQPQMHGPTG